MSAPAELWFPPRPVLCPWPMAAEFDARRNWAGVEVRYIDGGPRSMTVELRIRGCEVASKLEIRKRGKVSQTIYYLTDITPEIRERIRP